MKSIWQQNVQLPSFPALNSEIKTDVLIIGGGIAGILTAYLLEQNGVDYVLVEGNKICSGTSGNTTAKITFQHGLIYQKIMKSGGVDAAHSYFKANLAAFEKYAELCENIECDYEIKDNFVYSVNDRVKLENEVAAMQKIGFSAELCDKLEIPIKTIGAVKFANQAQFNPLKFISHIAKGLKIYEHTFVKEMIYNKAVTENGCIQANRVITATHFPFINKHGAYFLKLYQHRSYVIALENAQNVNGMYVDDKHTGMSFRNYGDYLLLGGGGHRTGKSGGNWTELRKAAKTYYPNSKEKYAWAAQDCMSLDSIPYIGRYSVGTPSFFVETGFNKWGMTGVMTAAMLMCDSMLGKSNDYSAVFNPSRSILKPQLVINGFEAAANLLKISKKRCPHLGCALSWNSAEHSWDCPCHGSRFSENGVVLDNPANGNLSN